MNDYISDFTNQMMDSKKIAEQFSLNEYSEIQNVVICGLGGSGIGGTILSQFIQDHCAYPVVSVKDYSIPGFVSDKTLVIACSYSGNTEETLEALAYAQEAGAQIACISSGGKLTELAKDNGWPISIIPGGIPPRAAFAYPMIQLLAVAEAYGLTDDSWRLKIEKSIEYLSSHSEAIKEEASRLAVVLQEKMAVIYSAPSLEGVAVRWKQQLAENAKVLAWHNVYPEMNHNELVGWRQDYQNLCVIFLHCSLDHARNVKRMELTSTVYEKYCSNIYHLEGKGDSLVEQAFYLIHLGDWVSELTSAIRQVDSIEVDVIDWLKASLSKI